MAGKYGAVVTDTGTRKIMEAMHEGRKVNIIEFAVGDGDGAPCTPDLSAVGLINENWRGKVDSCYVSEESENLLIIETVMPSDIGGFTIREMGVFDDEGALIAICNVPDTQKVKTSDGVVHELNLIMEIALSNIEGIELVVDPCVVMATKKDIKNINEKLDKFFGNANNSDGGIGFVEGIEADNVVDAINQVFQLGNKNKNKLVDNLVAMGVPASTEETWEELLNKVLDMTDTSKDTVTAEVLLEGYTAHNATGELVTGIIPERAGTTVETTGVTQDDSYTYFGVPEGHYDENSKVRAINSDLVGDIYDAFVAAGITPTAKTPDAIVASVPKLKESGGISSVSSSMSISDRWTVTSKMAIVTASAEYNAWMNVDNQGSGSAYCYLGTTGGAVRAQESVWVGTHDGGERGDGTYKIRMNKSAVFYKGEQVTVWGGSSRGYEGIRWSQVSLSMSAILLN